jgi:hypothetical protein
MDRDYLRGRNWEGLGKRSADLRYLGLSLPVFTFVWNSVLVLLYLELGLRGVRSADHGCLRVLFLSFCLWNSGG